MVAARAFNQHLVSSSKTIRPDILWSYQYLGHSKMLWSAICSVAAHSQYENEAISHLCIDYQNQSTPECRRLSLTHDTLEKPIGLVLTLGKKAWIFDDSWSHQCSILCPFTVRRKCSSQIGYRIILVRPIQMGVQILVSVSLNSATSATDHAECDLGSTIGYVECRS